MKTVLVTGGAGFIGGNFVLSLIGSGRYRVINLDALTYAGNLDTLAQVMDNADHVFIHGDIRDVALTSRLLDEHQPAAIVNFAAQSHVDRSIDSPGDFVHTNVVGTYELLRSSLNHWKSLSGDRKDGFRFIHISTDEVYGSLGKEGKFTETYPYSPNSPYAASKASSDHFVRAYHRTYGFPSIITNCSNNYGPYQFPEKLIPLVIHKALAGEPLPVYGDGRQVRDWLYVEDHCDAIEMVMERGVPGQVYNIGGNCEKTNLEVVRKLCSIIDDMAPGSPNRPHESLIEFVEDRLGHDRRYAIDYSKIEKDLGWSPKHTFDSGFAKTVKWYIDNHDWRERVMSGAYRGERLGLGRK